MPNFTPTPEQRAIVEAGVNLPDNLLVSALAGAAKTSTLELLAEAIDKPCSCSRSIKRSRRSYPLACPPDASA